MDIRSALNIIDEAPLDEERPAPGTHVLMLTGKIARSGLERVMQTIDPQDFTYEIRVMGVQVAAWLDADMIEADIGNFEADMILVPGKTTGDLEALSARLNVPVLRGPGCYSELPTFFEEQGLESIDDDDILRPHAAVIGSGTVAAEVARFIAETYQIPLIDRADLIRKAIDKGDERADILSGYDDPPHNQVAELVRERFLETDVRRGFVFWGYPMVARDVQWLTDMKIGIDMFVAIDGDDTRDLMSALGKSPRLVVVANSDDPRKAIGEALERVEQMMQQCLVPDQGMAVSKTSRLATGVK